VWMSPIWKPIRLTQCRRLAGRVVSAPSGRPPDGFDCHDPETQNTQSIYSAYMRRIRRRAVRLWIGQYSSNSARSISGRRLLGCLSTKP